MANNSDFEYAEQMAFDYGEKDKHPFLVYWFRRAIKRGRELAAAEAKPGLVWVKHDRSTRSPVSADTWVLVYDFGYQPYIVKARHVAWQSTSRYCVITIPE